MIYYKKIILLASLSIIWEGSANASLEISLNNSNFANSSHEIKLAAVCFLGTNCDNSSGFSSSGEDMTLDYTKMCKNEGFTITSCDVPTYTNTPCTYNPLYFSQCKEDKIRACKEGGYVNSCPTGEQLKTTNRCPWDNTYGTCCTTCVGYDYTESTIPVGYIADGLACESCTGKKYRIKINPCDGYKECDRGGALGSQTCMSGTIKKFDSCLVCPSNCFASCPAGTSCSMCDGKYCINTCQTGYWSYENYYCGNSLACMLPKP